MQEYRYVLAMRPRQGIMAGPVHLHAADRDAADASIRASIRRWAQGLATDADEPFSWTIHESTGRPVDEGRVEPDARARPARVP
ncbi:hypothetical protein [Actinomadura rayongensis]|uniref:Uncharacterized protein n=1 Tax=Actinomadura rayongensis TaxID=1429076 RepID=A0A6I4W5N5_9ACTN|nr:hypothetical protein [Actinomadura rayongensis]MXQ65487.1 hypothetical protein [Actinomadura rayongensis]